MKRLAASRALPGVLIAVWLSVLCPASAAPELLYQKAPDIVWDSSRLSQHSLSQLGLRHRKLVIFAPSPENAAFTRQLALLESQTARSGMAERDMVVIPVLQQGTPESDLADVSLSREQAAAVASAYGVSPGGFAVFLVGRTGVVKARADKPMEPAFLFELIDSLPMRRREMRNASETSQPSPAAAPR